jgi:hypothetical protein
MSWSPQVTQGGSIGGQTHRKIGMITGFNTKGQRTSTYPQCVRCKQNHSRDYSVSLGRCYMCKQEGHH